MKIIKEKILKKYHSPFLYSSTSSFVYYDVKQKLYVAGFIVEVEESIEELETNLLEKDILLLDVFEEKEDTIIECGCEDLKKLVELIQK